MKQAVRKGSLLSILLNSCDSLAGVATVKETETGIRIYPNPNDGSFSMAIAGNREQVGIMVVDLLGSVVLTKQIRDNNGEVIPINLGTAAPGIYIVCVAAGDVTYREKVVVH